METQSIHRYGIRGGAIVALALLMVACGGGGGSSGAAVSDTVVSKGVVDGFGSICLNGVRYDVDDSTAFDLDDSGGGDQASMSIGMVTTIQGRIVDDSLSGNCPTGGGSYNVIGVAESIDYDDEIQGVISAIDAIAGTFSIAGITIQTNDETVYRDIGGSDFSALVNGDYVEVSGLPGDGTILATYIEGKSGLEQEFELKGSIESLTATTFTLRLASMVTTTVDYSGATVDGPLVDGSYVEVKGEPGSVADIDATSVELEDRFNDRLGVDDNTEVEGVIRNLVVDGSGIPTEFEIGDIGIDIASAEIEGGSLTDLANGVRVEVEGFFDGSMIVATSIEFHEGSVKLRALWSGGQVMGVTIVGDAFTEVRDENGSTIAMATLSDGDYVEVRGFELADGSVRAAQIEVEESAGTVNPGNEVLLQGKVDSFDEVSDRVTILGIVIDTSGLDGSPDPSSDFEGLNDEDISRAAFYGALSVDTLVKARGADLADYAAGNLTADQIELED